MTSINPAPDDHHRKARKQGRDIPALPLAVRYRRDHDAARLAAPGMLGFALASTACGLTAAIAPLIVMRAVQGAFAAVVLVAAFELLNAGEPGAARPRAWVNTAVIGAAIGPALGGALTELLDLRAIFLLQAPVIAAAGLMCLLPAPVGQARFRSPSAGRALRAGTAVCLALLSGALTGVLFLAVLLLIVG